MSILENPPAVPKKSKVRLGTYTEEASLPPPVYQTFTGEDKSLPSFRSQVWVDGKCFVSPNSYPNKKDAECDAAWYALTALRGQAKNKEHLVIHEDSAFCKSIVNEFALKMNSKPPTYTTNERGATPMFVTSLQLNDVTYVGKSSKDKKDAEQSAARAAILSILGSGSTMSEIVKSKSQLYEAFLKVKESPIVQGVGNNAPDAVKSPPPASSVTMVTGIDIVSPTSEQAPATGKKKLKKRKLNNGLLLNPYMEGKDNEVAAVKVPPLVEITQPSSLVPVPSIVQHVLPEPNTVVALKSPAEIQQPSSLVTFPDIIQHVVLEPNTEAPRESVHVFKEQELLQASSSPSPHAIAPPPASSVTMVPGIDIVPPALDQAPASGKRNARKMKRKNRLLVNPAMEGKENEIVAVKVPPPAEIQQPSSLVTCPDIVQHVLPEPNTKAPRESVHVSNEQELLLVNQAAPIGKRNRKKMRRKNGLLVNPSMEDKKNVVVAVKVSPHAEIPQSSSLVPFPDIIQHVRPELNTVVAVKGPSPAEIPQPISLLLFPHNVQHVLPEPNTEAPRESVHVVKEHKLLQASSSQSPHAIAPPASSVTMVPGIDIVPTALDQAPATEKKKLKRKRKNGLQVNPSIEDKENEDVDVKDPPAEIPQPCSLVPFPAIVQHVLPEPNTVVAVKSPPTEIPHPSSLVQFPDNVQHVLPEPNTEAPRESVHVVKEYKLLQAASSPSPHANAPPASSVTMVPGIDIVPTALDQAPATEKKKLKKRKRKNGIQVNPSIEDKENEDVDVKDPPAEIPQPSSLVPFPAIVQHVLPEPNTVVAVNSPPTEIPHPSSLVQFPDNVQHVLPEPNTKGPRESVHVFKEQKLLQVSSSLSPQAIAPPVASSIEIEKSLLQNP
ncbi:hypothetical protein CASFOL_018207 [Castilleja foliolosa]|uniref:DRBM domain-containing protein n=1 Tax=Castilleja foliolosa TaxID=1961234 RepID=A0ABD3D940_9LAMI